jgi:Ca2+-transporting ATPase
MSTNVRAPFEGQDLVPAAPHSTEVQSVLDALSVTVDEGLDNRQALERLRRVGPNTIVARQPISAFTVLIHQLRSPVVYLLSAAAALAFYFGEVEEGAAIATVLAINSLIGFFTEIRAARSIEALRALGRRSARIRRGGHVRVIPAEELVPGDIVLVESGDAISADLRIVEASHLGADESTLTGESVPVEKGPEPVVESARITERCCMLFKGTAAIRGSGVGVVVGTGLNTELGRISQLVEKAEPESSPLERRLTHLSAQLVWAIGILTLAIAALGLSTGKDTFLMVEAAIALAVAAIPEGLPIVATLALARGMWRMARQNALIERLSAVETLGATTVILTDKTGTLTENRMIVRRLWVASGEVDTAGKSPITGDALVRRLLEVALLCNDATLGHEGAAHSGDPMEIALLRAGRAAGLSRRDLLHSAPVVRKHAFEADSKMMATVHRHAGEYFFAVKGASEAVLKTCSHVLSEAGETTLNEIARRQWTDRVEELGRNGLRVLACASKTEADPAAAPYEGLTFLGLLGLEDPARADVPHAIRDCQRAGIRVIMVTGDHAATARSIARAVGLEEHAAMVVEGRQVERLIRRPHYELKQVGIFARVSPAEKIALVRSYQKEGEIVAMTGDGVNDAPALKQADIGVAMGMRGTDVAREAAAMILLDDAFPTIVKAIREGRVIFGNIRRFAAYLLSCNLTEVLIVGLAIASALPLPIQPLQILYLNLITDVFPAFALAMSEGEPDVLSRPPRSPKEAILGRPQWVAIVLQSFAMTAGTFVALVWANLAGLDDRAVVTTTFLTVAFAQLWHVFNMRGAGSGLIVNEVTRNPWVWAALVLCTALLALPPYWPAMAGVLHLAQPNPATWTIVAVSSVAPFLLIQLVTIILTKLRRRPKLSVMS